jgi:multimeric flavodoxin WrbA
VKILAISCSPRPQGNTVTMLKEALRGAQQEGGEVELYSVSGKDLQPCDGCWTCTKTGICHVQDDMQELYDKMLTADGIIFGTPIYFYGMAAQMKIIIDRSHALNVPGRRLANKVGGVIVDCGSLGMASALKDLYFYIVMRRMLPANFVAAYVDLQAKDFAKMEQCRKATFDLGRQMVRLAAMKFEYPSEFMGRNIAYGTHTK